MASIAEKTIYQIYPKSFNDSDGDGIGDLQGIIEKLDYFVEFGVDMLWISPIYPSPQRDNGYDVSDYTAINPTFGSMADFEELVQTADDKGIDIMLDMVFNHTSTEHEWFQKALAGDDYYKNFYYLRPLKDDGSLPTNWESKFGGPSWNRFGDTDQYYLCLYDKTQADLNWHNPNVRKALQNVCNFWLDKGVKGFRFDVANVIGKDEVLVDSDKTSLAQEKALYTDRPIVHEWLHELNQASFGQRDDIITVGEMSSTDIENGIKYTDPDRQEFSMIFQFHHLKVDYENGDKWTLAPFDFQELKDILNDWQESHSEGNGWLANFINNHDQPRSLSRFGDPENYPYESATSMAQTIQFMRGTPYIYQGEEIGMLNPDFNSIDDYVDVESLNNYQILLEQEKSEQEALDIIQAKSRDNSRTPMQWDDSDNAGFTSGQPWLKVPDNYKQINVESQINDENSIFAYYKKLIQVRKDNQVIQNGGYKALLKNHDSIFAYKRVLEDQVVLVLSNFYGHETEATIPSELLAGKSSKLIGNGPIETLDSTITLQPYETVAFLVEL